MSDIEEDIKIINKIILFYKDLDTMYDKVECNEIKALNNLLQDYTRQKQINEEHQKINGELREKVKELEENRMFKNNKVLVSRYFKLKDNSIPKQKIKDKIEEYYKKMEEDKGNVNWIITDRIVMNVLQELLQESEEK